MNLDLWPGKRLEVFERMFYLFPSRVLPSPKRRGAWRISLRAERPSFCGVFGQEVAQRR